MAKSPTDYGKNVAAEAAAVLIDFFVSFVAAHFADGVFEHDVLLEQVVDSFFALGVVVHRALEEEAQEALDAEAAGASGEVAEQYQVEAQGSGEDGVAAQEVDFDLHGVSHPSEDVDVVPAFLIVVARGVVVDTYFVVVVAVEVGLLVGFEDCLECGQFGNLFGAEVGGFVEYEAVAVAEDIGREPSVQAEAACADDGGEAGFNECLTGLEVFAGDGHLGLFGQFPHCGDVDGGVGSAHDEGCAFFESCICVAHRGGYVLFVVSLHGCFEGGECVVYFFVYGDVNFGGSGPQYDYAVKVLGGFEVADVFADVLDHFPAGGALHVVFAIEAFCVIVVESGAHGLDGFELVGYGFDVFFFEHFGVDGRLVSVGGIYVPSGEFDVVEVGDGHDVFVVEVFFVSTFAHTDFVVLGHAAYGFGQAFTGHQHTGHKCCGDGAEADYHHAQFALGGLNIRIAHNS